MLRTALGATHVRMAAVAAGVARDGAQALELSRVALGLPQSPGPVERRRPQIVPIPGDHLARAVADPAADAFDAGIRRLSVLGGWRHGGEIVLLRAGRLELPFRPCPLVEELAHVGDQVADDRQV